jgi:hypothetical protein
MMTEIKQIWLKEKRNKGNYVVIQKASTAVI